jgi:hypothetical protein
MSRLYYRLLEAVDQAIIAARLRQRERALAPMVAKAKHDIGRAFTAQGEAFLAGLPGAQREAARLREDAIQELDWESAFDDTEEPFAVAVEKPLTTMVQAALRSGFINAVGDFKASIAFDLKNPRAVAYVKAHGADLVSGLNDTTRERMRSLIETAIEDGKSYGKLATEIRQSFEDMSRNRAELIAVTEAGNGYEAGNLQAAQGLKDEGLVVQKAWILADDHPGEDECDENADAGWIDVEDAFPSGDDTPLAHPNCVVADTRVEFLGPLVAATERRYEGVVCVITTAGGKQLTCTPNHPILTPSGWVSAGLLDVGSDVVCSVIGKREPLRFDLDDKQMPARVQDVSEAFGRAEQVTSRPVPVAPEDFHGDGEGSEIAVVWADGLLRNGGNASGGQQFGEPRLSDRPIALTSLDAQGSAVKTLDGLMVSSESVVGEGSEPSALFGRTLSGEKVLSLGTVATLYSVSHEPLRESSPMDADAVSKLLLRGSAEVLIDKVEDVIRLSDWSGHVYNLQTRDGFFMANSIVTHNCLCYCDYRTVTSDEEGD